MPGPLCRKKGLIVEEVAGETLVYDLDRHRAHRLNRTAAAVWAACDGRAGAAEIARSLRGEVPGVSRELVDFAIAKLDRAHLLVEGSGITRRSALRRLSVAAALVPLVTSIVVPEAAAAASCSPVGG